jgi:serine/threonine protein kinase
MATSSAGNAGARYGKYQVISHLKTGGMGAVYKALDRENARLVALKVLSPESAGNPKRLERFRREAQHGALLQHDNIVSIYEFGEQDGQYFLAMEFVEGVDLEEFIRRKGPLAPAEARHILFQIAQALDHAHQLGIVHRDIKPSNILLTQQHGRTVVKLADLGLARGGVEEESRVTADGSTVGTVDYMAPEQARDSGAADIRSDIYSLGCSLFHMLAGQPPFAEGSLLERVVKHSKTEPPDLRELNADVTDDLWAIVRRMLAKKPSQRYQTPAELLVDLTAVVLPPPDKSKKRRAVPRPERPTRLHAESTSETPASGEPNLQPGRIASGQFGHATQAITTGNFDYGMMLLLNCCRLEPDNVTYRQALRQAQLARAATAGLRAWRSPVSRLFFRAWLLVAKALKRPLAVLRCGEELLTCDPRDVRTQLDMAAAARTAGYTDTAVWMLEQAKHEDGDSIPLNRALAELYEERGDIRGAIELWEHLAELTPDDREPRNKIRDLLAHQTTRAVYDDRKSRTRTDKPDKTTGRNRLIT